LHKYTKWQNDTEQSSSFFDTDSLLGGDTWPMTGFSRDGAFMSKSSHMIHDICEGMGRTEKERFFGTAETLTNEIL